MESTGRKKGPANPDGGMDIEDVFNRIRQGRKTIYISVAIAFVLAIFIVILTPRKYNTQIVLLSETQAKNNALNLLGQLGGISGMNLGNLVGLNIGGSSGSDVLSPGVYPDIVGSTPFLMDVMNQKVTDSKVHKMMTVSEYLRNYSRPSLIGLMTRIFKGSNKESKFISKIKNSGNGVIKLTGEQTGLLKALSNMIQVQVRKSGDKLLAGRSKILTVDVEAQDPLVSALLADSVVSCLKRYVVDYNTGKAKKDLDFIQAQFKVARKNYYAAQKKLADFNDSHVNIILATINSERERLQKEYNLSASVYTSLAQLLEKAKISVQERTPVFTIIEPAIVPLKKSAPKTSLIILGMLFVGGFVGLTIELIKIMFNASHKERLK